MQPRIQKLQEIPPSGWRGNLYTAAGALIPFSCSSISNLLFTPHQPVSLIDYDQELSVSIVSILFQAQPSSKTDPKVRDIVLKCCIILHCSFFDILDRDSRFPTLSIWSKQSTAGLWICQDKNDNGLSQWRTATRQGQGRCLARFERNGSLT